MTGQDRCRVRLLSREGTTSEPFAASTESLREVLLVDVLKGAVAVHILYRYKLVVDNLATLIMLLLLNSLVQFGLIVVKVTD